MSPCGSSPTLGPSPTHRTPGAVARFASPRAVPATGSHKIWGLSRLLARLLLAMGGALYRVPLMQAFPAHVIFFPIIGLDGGDPFFIYGSNCSHYRASSQSETRDHEDHREGDGQHLHQVAYHRFLLQSQGLFVAAITCSPVTLCAFPATSALASPPSYGVAVSHRGMACGTKDLQRLPQGMVGRGLAVYRDSAVSAGNVTCVGRRGVYVLMHAELASVSRRLPRRFGTANDPA